MGLLLETATACMEFFWENFTEINRDYHVMVGRAMLAVTCSGRVMCVCSSCPQLSNQVAKGREYTQKRVIPPTWYTDLCLIPKDLSREQCHKN